MKKVIFSIALAIASLGAAQAQSDMPAQPEKQMHFLVGMGITFGGDKLAEVEYDKGSTVKLHAGGTVDFVAGIDYRVNPEFSFQGTIGYHVDAANASNGDVTFSRIPMEVLAYYHVSPQWRFGGGARYVSSVKLRSSGAGDIYSGNYDFKNTLSPVIEAEYMMNPKFGFKVRYVHEKIEEKTSGQKLDASHVGLFGTYYF